MISRGGDLPALRTWEVPLRAGIAVAFGLRAVMTSRLLPAGGVRGGQVEAAAERFHVTGTSKDQVVLPAEPFSASGSLHVLRRRGSGISCRSGSGAAEIRKCCPPCSPTARSELDFNFSANF